MGKEERNGKRKEEGKEKIRGDKGKKWDRRRKEIEWRNLRRNGSNRREGGKMGRFL